MDVILVHTKLNISKNNNNKQAGGPAGLMAAIRGAGGKADKNSKIGGNESRGSSANQRPKLPLEPKKPKQPEIIPNKSAIKPKARMKNLHWKRIIAQKDAPKF